MEAVFRVWMMAFKPLEENQFWVKNRPRSWNSKKFKVKVAETEKFFKLKRKMMSTVVDLTSWGR